MLSQRLCIDSQLSRYSGGGDTVPGQRLTNRESFWSNVMHFRGIQVTPFFPYNSESLDPKKSSPNGTPGGAGSTIGLAFVTPPPD